MKSEASKNNVEVIKRINLGHIPLFLQLAHKGLEKTMPEGVNDPQGGQRFVIAKDLLGVSITRPEVLEQVDHIEVVYQKA